MKGMKILKITIQAVLFNVSDEYTKTLNDMMLIFCTSIRYSFKRLLEGHKIGDLEKDVAFKYNLNIRQAKDAVESARQTIQSQKELLKLNYNNYNKKIKSIEKQLNNEKLSEKKQNALIQKLNKRNRILNYYHQLIDNNKIPSVIFGTKKMFLRRCKGLISNEEWKSFRNNRLYSRGDKTKNGNPNLRIIIKNKMTYLEVSTLEKTKTNRAIKIQIPIYLPQKLSMKTGKVNGNNYREMFLNYLETKEAYQVEILKRNNKYYVYITFEIKKETPIYTNQDGVIGVDTNPNGFALTYIDNKGNHKWHKYLKQHELKEKVPKILKNKLIYNKEEFNKKNEWSKWSIINNIIKGKVGEKPDLWIKNRKQTLGLAS